MSDTKVNNRSRQRVLILTATALLTLYYVSLALSTPLRDGALIAVALAITGICLLVATAAVAPNRRRRALIATGIFAFLLVVLFAMWPNYRRVAVASELRVIGATVTADTDSGDGIWFQWGSIYLPCWLKDYLGNEFFGRIDVEFDRTNVSPDVFANIVYNEPINTLTLRFADLSSGDLQRISRTVDAKRVRLLFTPVDFSDFRSLANMPSLEHIEVVHCDISTADCQRFLTRHPNVRIMHADEIDGHGYVRIPITEP